jgi:hypothetical protein
MTATRFHVPAPDPRDGERAEAPPGADVEITLTGHNLWAVTRAGHFVGALRWSGEHMRFVDPDGFPYGTLYRSDGKISPHEPDCPGSDVNFLRLCDCPRSIAYTWRAWATREVARGVSQKDAVAALLAARREESTR